MTLNSNLYVCQWEAEQWVSIQYGTFPKLWTGRAELTKANPQGHATGPMEPLEWSPSHHIQSAFYLLCVHKGELILVPRPFSFTPPSLPLPLMRRSQVRPLHNKNLPPLPNNHSRLGRRDHLKSIQQRMGDLIPPADREQSEARRGWLSSASHIV